VGDRLLLEENAVKGLAPGSVVVDLAAGPSGGNVAGARPGKTVVTDNDVTVIGAGDLPATVPVAASTAAWPTPGSSYAPPEGAFRKEVAQIGQDHGRRMGRLSHR